jgi:hypothetical protein
MGISDGRSTRVDFVILFPYPLFGRLYKHASASYTMDTELFSGVKLPGRGVNSPPPSSAELPLFFLFVLTAS